MKKIILLPLFAMLCASAKSQVTSLSENFNASDSVLDRNGTYNHYPAGWSAYSVIGTQDWRWEDAYGTNNSPCMHINGYQSGASNADENWLITPQLTLSSYTGSVYFNFAATYYYAGDSLHVMASTDYVAGTAPNFNNPDSTIYHWTELAHYGVMLYDTFYNVTGEFDEFQCNLTPYKTTPVYLAFKYTSDIDNASVWDLDSVTTGTTAFGLIQNSVANVSAEKLSVTVIGQSTANQIKLGFNITEGNYNLEVYDILGSKVYSQDMNIQAGAQIFTISNLNLISGLYIVKLGNEKSFGVTRAMVQ